MSEMRLKQNTTLPNIAWLPFYLQEHKSHNNVSLVMEHFFEDFQIFRRFSDFWETTTATKTILGLVTLETLITILTIENLNS